MSCSRFRLSKALLTRLIRCSPVSVAALFAAAWASLARFSASERAKRSSSSLRFSSSMPSSGATPAFSSSFLASTTSISGSSVLTSSPTISISVSKSFSVCFFFGIFYSLPNAVWVIYAALDIHIFNHAAKYAVYCDAPAISRTHDNPIIDVNFYAFEPFSSMIFKR